MDEENRKMFDEIRGVLENDLYQSLFCVWRDENYEVDYDLVNEALDKLASSIDGFKNRILKKGKQV